MVMEEYNVQFRCGCTSRRLGKDGGSDWGEVVGGALLQKCARCEAIDDRMSAETALLEGRRVAESIERHENGN